MGFISKDPKFDSLVVSNAQYAKYGTVKTASYSALATDYIIPVDSTSAGSAALAANYAVTTNANYGIDDDSAEARARGQAFVAATSGALTSITVKMSKSGSPTGGNPVATIRTFTNSVSIPGAILATSTNAATISSLSVDPSFADVVFTFNGAYSLVSGTTYIMTVETTGITGGQVFIRYDSGYATPTIAYRFRAPSLGGFWDVYPTGFGAGQLYFVVAVTTPSVTVTLPAVASANKGQVLHIKDVGGAVATSGKEITVIPTGADTIDIDASLVIGSPYQNVTVVSDGVSAWRLL